MKDKVALITGSAQGIGKAIALEFAMEGAKVIVTDIDEKGLEKTAKEIAKKGGEAVSIVMDVSKPDSVKKATTEAKNQLGSIDILINNAGITTNVDTVINMSEERWNREISINLSGAFYCTKQVLPDMVEKKWGRIINISSAAGSMGGFGQCSYSASKAGLLGLTKVITLEHARDNITANALVLGLIRTDAYKAVRDDLRERIEKRIPIQRPGEPIEVANVVAFLASDMSSYINGAEIYVTSGIELFNF